jgi:hypothetical protein
MPGRHFYFACGLFGSAFGRAEADLATFLFPKEPDIIVNAEVYEPGAIRPSPAHPVYYMAVLKGYRQFGYEMPGEKVPESKGVLKIATKILASQGYQLASEEHLPTLLILYAWGDFHRNPNPFAHSFTAEILDFLGGTQSRSPGSFHRSAFPDLDGGLTTLNPDSSTFGGFVDHGIYVITFYAYDFPQAQKGVAKILWKTNVSASTRGFYLPEVLPTMLTVGAPFLGRATVRPVRIDVSEKYTPRINLGPLKITEEDVKLKKSPHEN